MQQEKWSREAERTDGNERERAGESQEEREGYRKTARREIIRRWDGMEREKQRGLPRQRLLLCGLCGLCEGCHDLPHFKSETAETEDKQALNCLVRQKHSALGKRGGVKVG